MQLGSGGGLHSFEHFLDEIDPSARTIEVIAEQLIGWTSCRAEPAVDAAAHDVGCDAAIGAVLQVFRKLYFHFFLTRALDRDVPD
jgi:hypothetical protein